MSAPPPRPKSARRAEPRPAGRAPDRTALHEAALRHLARFGTTETGLVRVLDRRIDRWSRLASQPVEGTAPDPEAIATAAATARQAARDVARALVAAGAVNDAAYAESRSRSLTRAGRSRRGVVAHLEARGVPAALARDAMPSAEAELAAAVAYARRRRTGPFRTKEAGPDTLRKELAALARAGFPADVAGRALRLDRDAAEALLAQLRQL